MIHVVEAPDAWTSRLPAKYKDVCLRYVIEDGEPTWQFEDVGANCPVSRELQRGGMARN